MNEINGYRTHAGDVLRDERTGIARIVLAVWRAEDIDRFADPTCYLHRPLDERCALHGGGRAVKAKKGRS